MEKVTVEKNEKLPDATPRERLILIVASLVILFMGIFSPMFTHRMDATTTALLQQVSNRGGYQLGARKTQHPARASAAAANAHELALRSVSLERQARP